MLRSLIDKRICLVRELEVGVVMLHEGTIKWFDLYRGYGFIRPATGGDDVFVHISAVTKAKLPGLNKGDRVSFELVPNPRTGREGAAALTLLGAPT